MEPYTDDHYFAFYICEASTTVSVINWIIIIWNQLNISIIGFILKTRIPPCIKRKRDVYNTGAEYENFLTFTQFSQEYNNLIQIFSFKATILTLSRQAKGKSV